jgi:hypothetical protein
VLGVFTNIHSLFRESGERKFEYDLLPSASSFRLLTIVSNPEIHSPSPSISVELTTHDLHTTPSFNALSFTWGHPYQNDNGKYADASHDPFVKITCNGKEIEITQNLFDGLYALKDKQERHLWVDALCINQANLPERAAQVSLMG